MSTGPMHEDGTPFGRDGDHCAWCAADWKRPHHEDCPTREDENEVGTWFETHRRGLITLQELIDELQRIQWRIEDAARRRNKSGRSNDDV